MKRILPHVLAATIMAALGIVVIEVIQYVICNLLLVTGCLIAASFIITMTNSKKK